MKKTTKKLSLKSTTVHNLSASELGAVVGGLTFTCTTCTYPGTHDTNCATTNPSGHGGTGCVTNQTCQGQVSCYSCSCWNTCG